MKITMFEKLRRFFGMYAPSDAVRVAMYRKAGIRIGRVAEFGSNIWIDINFKNFVTIGDNVILAGYNHILSHSFLMAGIKDEGFQPVVIEKGARIGSDVMILPGVTIGENSVIGAGAVVAKDIPPNCVAVGIPAKPIKYFEKSSEETQETLTPISKLYVKCKTCGEEFWSAIRCNKKQFKDLELLGNHHPCPICGHNDRYNKEDYYFLA